MVIFMALSIFKIVVTATTTAKPTVENFFYKTTAAVTGSTLTIDDTSFVDDAGDPVGAGGITLAAADNGYYTLLVNGVPMETGSYAVTADDVVITIDAAEDLDLAAGTPIVLMVTNFAPESTITG